MPIERQRCGECGERHLHCPDCGSRFVTPRDGEVSQPTPNEVVDFGHDDLTLTYTHVCWDCGWSEEVTLAVDRREL